jgi:hypothetical protein
MRGSGNGQLMSTFRGRGQLLRRKKSLAPAREGCGECAGANDAPIAQTISISHAATERRW